MRILSLRGLFLRPCQRRRPWEVVLFLLPPSSAPALFAPQTTLFSPLVQTALIVSFSSRHSVVVTISGAAFFQFSSTRLSNATFRIAACLNL
ncbi:hypothetical protein K435DRAFT_425970 [Dendrothele bispora CBS 962.96]|uniref:Uncharacterized protein n=1 Tax=Dendrothele bispora (strain CBS 962.96) TaxID=1314807 RepID=A0A4S8L526_DENBC|nr:hypothetical protein K435DRAFT_425970 [Dendrothele bispora CBS 962.96]